MQSCNSDTTKKKYIRVAFLLVVDCLTILLSGCLALLVRFDFHLTEGTYEWIFFSQLIRWMPLFILATIAVYVPMKLYNSLWEFASLEEFLHIIVSVTAVNLFFALSILLGLIALPASFPILNAFFLTLFTVSSRFSYRLLRGLKQRREHRPDLRRTMLIGAGEAGEQVLREMQTSERAQNEIVCVIDDDRRKLGQYIRNVKIAGTRRDIVPLAREYRVEEIIFAIPVATARDRRDILRICQATGCRLKTLPGLAQLANGEVSIQKIREVDILDLLGRDSVQVDLTEIAGYLQDKTVLVTGGGGSIGSELCRQIARHIPKRLIIFDIYENNAYDIQQELRRAYPDLELVTLIGSVRDEERIGQLFEVYRPQIVFHAAAHKHVPLMEDSPNEAIKNNVFGTLHVAQAADRYGAETFALISTDKAVNPTNIMGASKRICEMIVQTMANHSKTKFVAVRFGNVLGSNGSVIPLFKRQIAEGGPVTVTHPDIIRYFMTIPEAVSLVLQAGAYARRGEIFVLDMGEPVRIDDLARNLIRLSGFEPNVDIDICYTGLRPGEKLYEEMLMHEEGLKTTDNALIHIGRPLELQEDVFLKQLARLEKACAENAPDIKTLVATIATTYHIPAAAGTANGKDGTT